MARVLVLPLAFCLAASSLAQDLEVLSVGGTKPYVPPAAEETPSNILQTGRYSDDEGGTHGPRLLPFDYKIVRRAEAVRRKPSYPWRQGIVTTVFWVGEQPGHNNPVGNDRSSWDKNWLHNYGGVDTPDSLARADFRPKNFQPKENPFYIALPYNDITKYGTKEEAAAVIPWFERTFERTGQTVLKGRWVAVHKGGRVAFAQWEDCGPFRTDHWQYVFGNERPKPNLNHGAGLDVSPAVRDFLGLGGTDVTDWRFVEASEVPDGPWRHYGHTAQIMAERSNRLAKVPLAADNIGVLASRLLAARDN